MQPRPLLHLFSTLYALTQKNDFDVSCIQSGIVKVEGTNADHLTTTTSIALPSDTFKMKYFYKGFEPISCYLPAGRTVIYQRLENNHLREKERENYPSKFVLIAVAR